MIKRKARKSKPNESRRLKTIKEMARAELADQIMSMRRQGWALRAIAAALTPPISYVTVKNIIDRELRDMVFENVDELRKLELSRLDELQTAHHTKAVNGDQFATTQVLSIMDRRAKLTGISAPERSIVKTEADTSAAELDAKLEALSKKLAESDAEDVAKRASKGDEAQ